MDIRVNEGQLARRFVIHPGFGKSGTTTLQENLFARHSGVTSIGRPFTDLTKSLSAEITKIEYDAEMVAALAQTAAGSARRGIVLSNETLVTNAYMRETVAARLKRHFPGARIIFTIRNQITALESYYANHGRILKGVPAPYQGQYVSFENWIDHAYTNRETSFLGLIDYDRTISLYERLFGADSVSILLTEEIGDAAFAKNLAALLAADEAETAALLKRAPRNKRDSRRLVSYARLRRKFLPGIPLRRFVPGGRRAVQWLSRLNTGAPYRLRIEDPWREKLYALYRPGNTRLSERHKLPLVELGYP